MVGYYSDVMDRVEVFDLMSCWQREVFLYWSFSMMTSWTIATLRGVLNSSISCTTLVVKVRTWVCWGLESGALDTSVADNTGFWPNSCFKVFASSEYSLWSPIVVHLPEQYIFFGEAKYSNDYYCSLVDILLEFAIVRRNSCIEMRKTMLNFFQLGRIRPFSFP